MTPEDAARHIALIRELSSPGGPVTKDAPTASISNPEWWIDGELTPPRSRLFAQLLEDAAAKYPDALNERRALVLAGPPGAGKGSVADRVLGAAKASYVNVDADEFKSALLRQAIADRSYESWIKPPAVRELEAGGSDSSRWSWRLLCTRSRRSLHPRSARELANCSDTPIRELGPVTPSIGPPVAVGAGNAPQELHSQTGFQG